MSESDREKTGLDPNELSPEELQQWLLQEVRDATKALDLRLQEATSFVSAYSLGKISQEDAAERQNRYQWRWGEALFGANALDGISDEQILRTIDDSREQYLSLKDVRERYQKRFGKSPGEHKASR